MLVGLQGEPGCLEGCTSMGPWGGPGGSEFSFCVKGGIKQIVIAHGVAIDSIIFKGDNGDGVLEESDKFGGNGGSKTTIDIAWPKEYLTSISGSYESFYSGNLVIVTSLCFITNHTKYGPFGIHQGTSFSSTPMEGGGIIGFHGRCGRYFDAIGVYAKPISECQKNEKGEHGCLEGCISMGPWGGPGGSNFSFFVKGGIKQIVIAHGLVIDSIIFKGDNGDGVLEESNKFGGNGGGKTDTIDIAWPEEYLTSISGSYGTSVSGCPALVASLCFITNRTKYGPFGTPQGTSFASTPMEGGGIIGFHGRAGQFFDAIGVYAKPMSECQKIAKVSKDGCNIGTGTELSNNANDDVAKDNRGSILQEEEEFQNFQNSNLYREMNGCTGSRGTINIGSYKDMVLK
ncbi:hypothetical protein L1049_014134 [Liquidambar formosana]|uniref:Jacalin-type lectin domain-containing protein n=1 Tax=Liquidambar formosana TaxID=63359 RepID=A0AAP0RMF1_LIQFO